MYTKRSISAARAVLLGTTILASTAALSFTPALSEETLETVTVTGIRASLQSAQAIKQNSDLVVDSITAVDIGALPDSSVAEALQRVPGVQITRTDQVTDPLRWAGFGNGVFVRGLSWVESLTNGEETFGAENGRTISFADISSDLMAGVDLYKNPSAKMIEGGVGGTVNLKNRRPFDFDGRRIAFSGNLNYGQLSDHGATSINALYSDRFNTKLGEVGVLVSADYQNLLSSNNVVSTDPWNNTGKVSGETVTFPKGYTNTYGMIGYRHMDWKQPRIAIDTTVQWRPTEALEVTFIGIFSKAEPQSNEHNVAWIVPEVSSSGSYVMPYAASANTTALANSVASYKYDASGYWTGGTIYNAAASSTAANYFDTRFDARHHINKNFELNAKYNPTENWQFELDANYIDSRATMQSMTVYNMLKNDGYRTWTGATGGGKLFSTAPEINVGVDISDNSPSFTYNSTGTAALADQSNYLWAAAMDHYENNYAHAYTTRGDATYTFSGSGLFDLLKSVEAGFRVGLKQAITRNSGWHWGRIGFETWSYGGCNNNDTTGSASTAKAANLAACAAAAPTFSSVASSATTLYDFPDVFGSKMPSVWEPKMSWLKNPYKMWSDIQAAETMSTSVGRTGVWTPLIALYGTCTGVAYKCNYLYTGTSGSSSTAGISNQKENTFAGYMQADFAHDNLFGLNIPINGNVGVRIVHTDYDSGEGYLKLPSITACAATVCTDRNAAITFAGGTSSAGSTGTNVSYAPVKNSYTNALPSFNFIAHLSDELLLRLAYSQGLVRPELSKMRNYTSVGFAFGTADATTGTDNTGTFASSGAKTGSGSNPYLKPTYSQNYDVSAEWYFSKSSSLALAYFHKTISNYVMSGAESMTLTSNGVTETFNVSTYINGDKGQLDGLEAQYTQFFDDYLPGVWGGLGVQANYTKLYNSGGHNSVGDYSNSSAITYSNDTSLPMEGMSNDSYNVALIYEKFGISARLAYNWRSSFLVSSYATNLAEPVFQRNYGQLDTSVLYSFLDHYKVGVQVSNMLAQTTVLQIGTTMSNLHNYEWVEGERKFSLIMRANW